MPQGVAHTDVEITILSEKGPKKSARQEFLEMMASLQGKLDDALLGFPVSVNVGYLRAALQVHDVPLQLPSHTLVQSSISEPVTEESSCPCERPVIKQQPNHSFKTLFTKRRFSNFRNSRLEYNNSPKKIRKEDRASKRWFEKYLQSVKEIGKLALKLARAKKEKAELKKRLKMVTVNRKRLEY